jgi:hypothetical protein
VLRKGAERVRVEREISVGEVAVKVELGVDEVVDGEVDDNVDEEGENEE